MSRCILRKRLSQDPPPQSRGAAPGPRIGSPWLRVSAAGASWSWVFGKEGNAIENAPAPAAGEFTVVESAEPKKTWKLFLLPGRARLQGEEGEILVPREELYQRVQILDGIFFRRVLLIQVGKKHKIFRLEPAVFEAFLDWSGPPTLDDLRAVLKRRLRWTLSLGLLYIVLALPLGGVPPEGIPEKPWDYTTLALGGALILLAIVSRIFPSAFFLLIDSFWFGLIGANTVYNMIRGETSPYLGGFVLLFVLSAIVSGVKEYRRLTRLGPAATSPPANERLP